MNPSETACESPARNEGRRVLWGYVSSKETLGQAHSLVGIYDTFRILIAEELKKAGLAPTTEGDPIKEAEAAISKLESTVGALRKSIQVKKVSEATVSVQELSPALPRKRISRLPCSPRISREQSHEVKSRPSLSTDDPDDRCQAGRGLELRSLKYGTGRSLG